MVHVVLATNRWSIVVAVHKQVVHKLWYQSVQAGSGSYGYATAMPATLLSPPQNSISTGDRNKAGLEWGRVTKARIT